MSDLFGSESDKSAVLQPLAERLRPKNIDEVIGQNQILSPDAPLGAMLASGQLSSLIFWGPPGGHARCSFWAGSWLTVGSKGESLGSAMPGYDSPNSACTEGF